MVYSRVLSRVPKIGALMQLRVGEASKQVSVVKRVRYGGDIRLQEQRLDGRVYISEGKWHPRGDLRGF